MSRPTLEDGQPMFSIREKFDTNLRTATKRRVRARLFDEEFGWLYKHLKNAVKHIAGPTMKVDIFRGVPALEYLHEATDPRSKEGHVVGSSVTWLEFFEATADRERAEMDAAAGPRRARRKRKLGSCSRLWDSTRMLRQTLGTRSRMLLRRGRKVHRQASCSCRGSSLW